MLNLRSSRYKLADTNSQDNIELWHFYEEKISRSDHEAQPNQPSVPDDCEANDLYEKHLNESIQEYSKRVLRYFIIHNHEVAGIFAIPSDTSFSRLMLVESLYVLPECRRQGLARELLDDLFALACASGLDGLRLQTEYHWKHAVNFYLHNHFWLMHWNDSLNFIRRRSTPEYRVDERNEWLNFCIDIDGKYVPIISARNDGSTLCWVEHDASRNVSEQLLLEASSTLSLHIAVRGWPLVRSGEHRWLIGDCGGPEALATQVALWESPVDELGSWQNHIETLNKMESSRSE